MRAGGPRRVDASVSAGQGAPMAQSDDNDRPGGRGGIQPPLPAVTKVREERRELMRRRVPSSRERSMSLAAGAAIAALSVVLLVWVVAMAFGGSSSGGDADATASSSSGAPAEAAPSTASVTLSMVGDVVLHPSVYSSGQLGDGSFDFSHLFAHVGEVLDGSDIQIVSQETPIAGASYGYSYQPVFNGPTEVGDAEAAAGFNVVAMASDHTLDKGYDALHDELAFWEKGHPDVEVLGVRDVRSDDPGSFDDVYVYEKDGVRVAVLDYTASLGLFVSDPEGAVSVLDESQLERNVEEARRQADFVVVIAHWGDDGSTTPNTDQRQAAQLCANLGVDVLIGTHPHVLQPVEVVSGNDGHQMVCFWSIGSFISGFAGDSYLVGGIAQVTFEKSSDGVAAVASYGLVPVVTHKGTGTAETVYPLSDYTAAVAATNTAQLSPEAAQQVASSVLGEAYDADSSRLEVSLGGLDEGEGSPQDASSPASSGDEASSSSSSSS